MDSLLRNEYPPAAAAIAPIAICKICRRVSAMIENTPTTSSLEKMVGPRRLSKRLESGLSKKLFELRSYPPQG